jgi:hypothetical protein
MKNPEKYECGSLRVKIYECGRFYTPAWKIYYITNVKIIININEIKQKNLVYHCRGTASVIDTPAWKISGISSFVLDIPAQNGRVGRYE